MLNFFKKIKPELILIILLVIISILYGYLNILNSRPYSIHQWRQTDCASILLNYYQEGMDFFHPKLHFQGVKEGRGIAEFPIIFYFNAFLWKLFTPSEMLARLVNILIVFTGLLFLFKTLKILIENTFWSILITLLVFSSPVLVFYSNTFMPNAPALGVIFIGWFYFLKYYKTSLKRYLLFSMLFFTLSSLLRSTMVIGFLFIYLIFFIELIGLYKFGKDKTMLFSKSFATIVIMILPPVFFASWYIYAFHYNGLYDSTYFTHTISPFWSVASVKQILIKGYHNIFNHLHSYFILFLSILFFIAILLNRKKQNLIFLIAIISFFLLTLIYFCLWFLPLDVHDYYLIDSLIFIASVFIIFFTYLKNSFPEVLKSRTFIVVGLVILCANIYRCALYTRIKYDSQDKLIRYSFILSEAEINLWNWYHWDYNNSFKALETITPYLRSLGIKRSDIVISIPDPSPNITLYLMDQKGFTDLFFVDLTGADRIKFFINSGAKYLIINRPETEKAEYLQPFLKKKIGSYGNVSIYDLK
jgi:hypothetical protein